MVVFIGYIANDTRMHIKLTAVTPELRGYSLLQNLAVCGLRITKVHQLIHQLVNDDKVISDALLFQFFEIF